MKPFDCNSNAPHLHDEALRQYHDALRTVRTQIDMIVHNRNSPHAWLNEVQRYLNRARQRACEHLDQQDGYVD